MRASVRAAFLAFTEPLEGKVRHFYADVKGYVTIAIGNLVDDTVNEYPPESALALPMRWSDGRPATRADIREDWLRLKRDKLAAAKGWPRASQITNLRLTEEDVNALVFRKLDSNDVELRKQYPDFEEWSADAQLATISMAWAMGPHFGVPGPRRFPKLAAALRARDFATAAKECFMTETGNPGLAPRNLANRVLYTNAAIVERDGHSPAVLWWPRDLETSPIAKAPPTLPAPVDDETEPVLVPSIPPRDGARTVTPWDIVHPRVPLGRPRLDFPDDDPDSGA